MGPGGLGPRGPLGAPKDEPRRPFTARAARRTLTFDRATTRQAGENLMSSTLLEQYIRLQSAITQYASDLRQRVSEEAGQTTVEWLGIMVGLPALATALVGAGIGTQVAQGIANAVGTLISKTIGHAV